MLLKVVSNRVNIGREENIALTEGQYYVCYAVILNKNNSKSYFIDDDTGCRYPQLYPEKYFEVIDESLSRYWCIGNHTSSDNEKSFILAFDEWANDDLFHGRMFMGSATDLKIYEMYKDKMEVEYLRPDAFEFAEKGDKLVVFDPDFKFCWKANLLDALTVCPDNNKVYINPYYVK